MNLEREKERRQRAEENSKKMKILQEKKEKLSQIKNDFYALFAMEDRNQRGLLLEKVLNSYFMYCEILVKENFRLTGDEGAGILEQIDGIVELDGQVFLVEMKWRSDPIGRNDIYTHLGRIYHRTNAHGIYISAAGYSSSAIEATLEALLKSA